MRKGDANSIIVAGFTLYFIGCVGLFTSWKTHQSIDVASSAVAGTGLMTVCVGVLLIEGYLLFKAFALIGFVLVMAIGISWILHLPFL
jgi:hypothetical protein